MSMSCYDAHLMYGLNRLYKLWKRRSSYCSPQKCNTFRDNVSGPLLYCAIYNFEIKMHKWLSYQDNKSRAKPSRWLKPQGHSGLIEFSQISNMFKF